MRISDLTAYAEEKYNITEQFKWADFPGFSVLADPENGKWIALLMRQWDSETGTETECCDLKCGIDCLSRERRPYLSHSVRMHGAKWINIRFDDSTEEDVVCRLFDKAVKPDAVYGHTIILASQLPPKESKYQDTVLPFAGTVRRPEKDNVMSPLREMRRLYGYGRGGTGSKAENFYRQAEFLKDYEDDYPWSGNFICYFPTYDELTTKQLRGYFSWRTRVRKGEYGHISTSAAYLYLYELLNGIGADSPEGCLDKMKDFEAGYLDSGVGDERMRTNLRRWMMEYAVLMDLPVKMTIGAADPELIARDTALSVLRQAGQHSDEEVFSALCFFGTKKTPDSPVFSVEPERGKHLFCETWRAASSSYSREGKDLFTLCFGVLKRRPWYPLSNAPYYDQLPPTDREYVLDECRMFCRVDGTWYVQAYENLYFDRDRFRGFLHEADAKLRRYLKTGRYMREKAEDKWVIPYVEYVIDSERKAIMEAARPKITIDLTHLEKIREDAVMTRDSLLTEEDLNEYESYQMASDVPERYEINIFAEHDIAYHMTERDMTGSYAKSDMTDLSAERDDPDLLTVSNVEGFRTESETTDHTKELSLDSVQLEILRALLNGIDAAEIIKVNHLMPSIAADLINEALFDEFGDIVVSCDDDRLSLVEDYIEDLDDLLGGHGNGQA